MNAQLTQFTEAVLSFCLMAFPSNAHSAPLELRIECAEQIVNCAILDGGKLKTNYKSCFKFGTSHRNEELK